MPAPTDATPRRKRTPSPPGNSRRRPRPKTGKASARRPQIHAAVVADRHHRGRGLPGRLRPGFRRRCSSDVGLPLRAARRACVHRIVRCPGASRSRAGLGIAPSVAPAGYQSSCEGATTARGQQGKARANQTGGGDAVRRPAPCAMTGPEPTNQPSRNVRQNRFATVRLIEQLPEVGSVHWHKGRRYSGEAKASPDPE